MSYLGKLYTNVKNENLGEFLKAHGYTEDKIAPIIAGKPTTVIVQNGDTYTLTQSFPKGPRVTTFKSGVEFDDVVGDDTPIKSLFTVSGNVITQQIKSASGNGLLKREFNGDELVTTLTSDKYDGVAKRYYKASA